MNAAKLQRRLLMGALFLTTSVLAPRLAYAQIVGSPDEIALARTGVFGRDQNIGVMDRPRPEFAPLGLNEGAFKIAPELTTALEYNDNIYAVPSNTTSDEIFHISPSVTATSDWSRNQVQFLARGSFNEYADHGSENANNYAVGANGRWDVANNAGIAAGADFEHNSESRQSPNSPTIAKNPVEYDLTSAYLVGAYAYNNLRLSARGDFQSYSYDNGQTLAGATVYQKDRDYDITSGTFRAEYAAIPGASVFANAVVNHQQNNNLLATDISRTSTGYELTVGSNFNITHLVRGEVFLGYLDQDFDDSRYKSVTGVSVRGYVEYYPTQLTTITVSGARIPTDSVIVGAGAYLNSNISARIDHELLRNLVLFGTVALENDDYSGISRQDNRNAESVGATYLLNRLVQLNLTYLHSQNKSSGNLAGLSFDINSLTAGVTLRY